jgi:PAS domain S-box-containing protein
MIYPLLVVALATIFFAFLFEFTLATFFAYLSEWQRLVVTLLYFTGVMTAGTYLVVRRERRLREQLLNEEREHGQLKEMQARLAERTRELERINQQLETQIAERKQAEETLRESTERLRLAIHVAQIGTWDWDANTGQVSSGGVPMFPLFGHDLQTYQGFFERIHPDDRENVGQAMAFSVVEDKPYNVEFRVVNPEDGSIRWIAAGGQMFRDEQDKALRMIGVAQDITERKQAEEKLEQERALLRTLIENLPDFIYVRDRDNRFLLGNAAVAHVMGTTTEAIVGKRDFDFYPHHLAAEYHADDLRVMQTGEPIINKEEINIDLAGVTRYVLTSKVPLRDKRGDIIGIIGIGRDITERKRMEMALLESRMRLDDILSSMQDIVWSYSAETPQTLYMSQGAERVFGRPLYEFFEDPNLWKACVHPEDLLPTQHFQETLLTRGFIEMEYRILRPDGEVRWLLDRGQVIRDASGKAIRLDGIATDITERKQAEERLAEERNLLRTLIDHLPHYIYIKDTAGRFVLDNIADARSMGAQSPEEVIGKTNFDLCPPDLAEKYHRDDMVVIQSGQPLLYHEETATNDKCERIPILTSKFPLRDSHGQVIGLIGISMDLTERKRAEQQAIELGTERARVKMLADFVRDASHDFRTPLSTINTSVYLLRKLTDRPEQLQRINTIEQQAAQVARLVEGLLTMTRLDSEATYNFRPLDVNRLVHDIQVRMSPLAANSQIELALDLADSLPPIPADPVELGTALMKLVENAVQYTPAGNTVVLRTRQVNGCALIEVCDPGIGIHPDDLPRIFERFYRVDKARSAQTGGVGLGLPIAQKVVEAHRGQIEVESAPGEGSTFRITLPLH